MNKDNNCKEDKKNIFDKRMMRPFAVFDKKTKRTYHFNLSESFTLNGKEISFLKPNIISLFASTAKAELNSAREIYTNYILPKLDAKKTIEFDGEELIQLYNFFEKIQTAIVTIYNSIEALSNITIPRDYKMEKKNNKGVKEIWNKENIERWMSTSEKIGDIVPSILKIDSPKKYGLWEYFKQLESIRNDIIHPKTTEDPTKVDTLFLRKLLNDKIFSIVESGFGLIYFFCEKDKSNYFLPLGFSEIVIQPYEIEDFDEYFQPIN